MTPGPIRTLAHELRQPLFALKGRLQIAIAQQVPLTMAELAQLLEQVEHLEQLLDWYASEATAEPERVYDLREPVRRAHVAWSEQAAAHGVVVEVALPQGEVPVMGRALALRQVTGNLLANALDALPGDGRREVRLAVEVDATHARLVVDDTGPGLSDNVRERVFEPFVSTKDGTGSGLGLFIARGLVTEASGTLTLENAPGGGTRATVQLPLAADRRAHATS